jgi:hypothetical protein
MTIASNLSVKERDLFVYNHVDLTSRIASEMEGQSHRGERESGLTGIRKISKSIKHKQ